MAGISVYWIKVCISGGLQAMKVVNDRMQQEANAKLQKEKELSRVKISKEDVDLIVSSIEALECLKQCSV